MNESLPTIVGTKDEILKELNIVPYNWIDVHKNRVPIDINTEVQNESLNLNNQFKLIEQSENKEGILYFFRITYPNNNGTYSDAINHELTGRKIKLK
jgi:hypothetical protein